MADASSGSDAAATGGGGGGGAAATAAPAAAMPPAVPEYRVGISDSDIMAQARDIEREVEEAQPLVGERVAPGALAAAYADNPALAPKIGSLATLLDGVRPTRGDGNCFYRGFLVSLGERMVAARVAPAGSVAAGAAGRSPLQDKYEAVVEYVRGSLPRLIAHGYPDVTMPDFYDAMMDYIVSWGAGGDPIAPFTDKMTGMYIITYMRCLCSLFLLDNEDDYLPYVLGLAPHCATVKQFCDVEVEAVSRDADQLQVIAASRAWSVSVRIAYVDASPGSVAQVMVFPDEVPSDEFPELVTLLYRPGHYDVAYFHAA